MNEKIQQIKQITAKTHLHEIFVEASCISDAEIRRIYLYDLIPKNENCSGVIRFLKLLAEIEKIITDELGQKMDCCLRYGSIENPFDRYSEYCENMKIFGLNIESDFRTVEYSESNERYYTYILRTIIPEEIKTLIWISIANGTTNVEPRSSASVFFFNTQVRIVINIYDDRGMDICRYV
jgi:hypothetical protein